MVSIVGPDSSGWGGACKAPDSIFLRRGESEGGEQDGNFLKPFMLHDYPSPGGTGVTGNEEGRREG